MGQARELMDRFTEAIIAGDLDALREIYAPDVVVTTPDSGTLHGVDQLLEWNEAFVGSFSDRQFDSLKAHETADSAIDQGDFLGTHTSPLVLPDGQTVPPTGKRVRMRSADVATVKDGKIVSHDFYFDQMDLLGQLGLIEAAAASRS